MITEEAVVRKSEADGAEAGRKLSEKLSENYDFGFLFVSPSFSDVRSLVSEFNENASVEDFIGCTTYGEISSEGPTDDAAVFLGIKSEKVDFQVGSADEGYENPKSAGKSALMEAKWENFPEEQKDNLVYTLTPGHVLNKSGRDTEVLKGLLSIVNSIPVVGGKSGDGFKMSETLQFVNGDISSDNVVVAAVSSELPIETGQEHGLKDKIATGVVKEVDGPIIKKIGNKDAAQFYADEIGVERSELSKLFDVPLRKKLLLLPSIIASKVKGKDLELPQKVLEYSYQYTFADEVGGELRVVTPFRVTDEGGLNINAEVSENEVIHIVEGEEEDIISAAGETFTDEEASNALFAVLNDCTVRNQVMGEEQLKKEVSQAREKINGPVIGFYGGGEIGGGNKKLCTVENNTVSGFLIREKE